MDERPLPIRWWNLPRWVRATRELDDERYRAPAHGPPPPPWRRGRPSLRRPVFVVGAPRSGTSFLGDALGVLPELSYHYEPPLTKGAVRYLVEGLWSERRWRRLVRTTYAWLVWRHGDGGRRFAEKTPQNCFAIDALRRAFPDAQFVHIVRDGRDAALSYRDKPWLGAASAGSGRRESGGYLLGPYPRFWVEPERRDEFRRTSDLHRCIWAWRRHTESARRALSGADEGEAIEVRYEALVADPAATGDALLRFLGIDAPDSRRALQAALAEANDAGVGRWRSAMGAEEQRVVDAEAGALLRELGYGEGAAA